MTALGLVQTAKVMEDSMDSHDGHDHRRRKRAVPDNESYVRISVDTFPYTRISFINLISYQIYDNEYNFVFSAKQMLQRGRNPGHLQR